jgi:hypothetical protein
LPRFLGGLPELRVLLCGKNPFRKDMVVPKNIVSKGDEAILIYLQALYGVNDGSLDTIKSVIPFFSFLFFSFLFFNPPLPFLFPDISW